MSIVKKIQQAHKPPISFEVVPPKRGEGIDDLLNVVGELMDYHPPFIDVTSHASKLINGNIVRNNPGTIGLCTRIRKEFDVQVVPHVLCNGYTKDETEEFLINLHFDGIHSVLALQGDKQNYIPNQKVERNTYASELVTQIQKLNNGVYNGNLRGHNTSFEVGVAGYPEIHEDAVSFDSDLQFLKQKVDDGASYIVTQMFFDNTHYFDFVNKCRDIGISVPIIPGLKVLTTKRHLESLPEYFSISLPEQLVDDVKLVNDRCVKEVGISWAAKQAEDLLIKGAPSLHFYVMRKADSVHKVMEYLAY